METSKDTAELSHKHGPGCGHIAIRHGDHVDYLHDGQLHHLVGDKKVEEHVIEVSKTNPRECKPVECQGQHEGAERIPHADHFDVLVNGRLHHVHGAHCDDHGPINVQ